MIRSPGLPKKKVRRRAIRVEPLEPRTLLSVMYTVTDLGTLGGDSSQAEAVNASGEVTGFSVDGLGNTHAFLYSDGAMNDLGTLGDINSNSTGYAINDSGDVAGGTDTLLSGTDAFLYSNGQMNDLGTLGGTGSQAFGINAAGDVVGTSAVAGGGTHAFLNTNAGMSDLGTLGGGNSTAYAINAAGQIVGQSDTEDGFSQAFSDVNNAMVDLGTLGGDDSIAYGVNSAGQIVGQAQVLGDNGHAFVYSGGMMTDLGTLGGHTSTAYSINSAGQIVGDSYLEDDVTQGAFLYSNGTMLDLNDLIDPSSNWQLDVATSINNVGQIAGYGVIDGQTHAFLLTPTAVTLTTPATAASVNLGSTFDVDWIGGSAGDTVQLWAEGGPNNAWTELAASIPASQGQFAWNTTGVAHGWYYFSAWVLPGDGSASYQTVSPDYLHVVNPNNHAPTISMTSPPLSTASVTEGAMYSLTYTATDADSDPLHVQLWVYSGDTGQWSILPGAEYLSNTGSYSWNTTGVEHGWYSFAAHVTDGDTWAYSASPGWLHVELPVNQTPTFTYLTPTNGQAVATGSAFDLQWNATVPAQDTDNMTVQIWAQHLNGSGDAVWTELATGLNPATGSYSWNTTDLAPGYYAFSIYLGYADVFVSVASPFWLQVT